MSAGTSDIESPAPASGRRFSVAPMMDCTDRHCRRFLRLLSRRALLYTEMIAARAVLGADGRRFLAFDPAEHPVALQLGGCDARELADAARIGADEGYDEINLNVGCPSDRVSAGRFGARLMAEPETVARCVLAMADAVQVPVTVKCRIGIDEQDIERDLDRFVRTLVDAGVGTLVVHARKAWLDGLSPKENRTVPPLDYARVYRLKSAFPDLEIILNGGIGTLDEAEAHLAYVDGVMLGRAAYQRPYLLAEADRRIFADPRPAPARCEVLRLFEPYVAGQLDRGVPLYRMTRHLLGLYHGRPGARGFRRHLSAAASRPGAGVEVLGEALGFVERDAFGAQPAAAE